MLRRDQQLAKLVMAALSIWIGLWVIQMLVVFHSQLLLENQLNERSEKMALCAQMFKLTAERGHDLEPQELQTMRDSANRLETLTHTPRGQALARNLVAAVERFASCQPSQRAVAFQSLQQLVVENNLFQSQRLQEDNLLFQQDMRRVRILVAATTGGATLLSGMVLGALLFWLFRQTNVTSLVVKSTRNAVLVGDQRNRVVLVNQAFAKLIGSSANGLTGLPLESIGPTGRLLARCIGNGEEVKEREVLWRLEGGECRCFLVDVILTIDRRGRVQSGMAVLRDITAQWEARQRAEREKAALRELASHDALTGLLNYGAFIESLSAQTEAAIKEGRPLSLLMIDLDHFKVYNDTLGHPAGDELLREFAGVLAKSVRAGDQVARYGGDEFVVILPDTDGAAAYQIAERLRRQIADHPFPGRNNLPEHRLTASIGVATLTAGIGSADKLIKAADEALYAAKLGARNRTEFYHSALSEFAHAIPDDQREPLLVAVRSNLLLLQTRDSYTYYHSERVAKLSQAIGSEMDFNAGEQRYLRIASVLHDIGKVCVPPEILTKITPLNPQEWEEIKRHPQFGAEFLSAFSIARPVIEAVRHHHERWDGTGYPAGLKGRETPLFARIIGVSDSFDAMTVDRPYRRGFSRQAALDELQRCAGKQFDPEIIHYFLRTVEKGIVDSIYAKPATE
ncbi:bifunctional diguanylate cyclase/phosphohydrolase [Desulfofundulus thermobenzoicus]|nr:diguanylate cyclase [Desulfofundulus thermobenzoicus]